MARKSNKTSHVLHLLAGEEPVPGSSEKKEESAQTVIPETDNEKTPEQTGAEPDMPNISIISTGNSGDDPVADLIKGQLEEDFPEDILTARPAVHDEDSGSVPDSGHDLADPHGSAAVNSDDDIADLIHPTDDGDIPDAAGSIIDNDISGAPSSSADNDIPGAAGSSVNDEIADTTASPDENGIADITASPDENGIADITASSDENGIADITASSDDSDISSDSAGSATDNDDTPDAPGLPAENGNVDTAAPPDNAAAPDRTTDPAPADIIDTDGRTEETSITDTQDKPPLEQDGSDPVLYPVDGEYVQNYRFVNVMEYIVKDLVVDYMKKFDMCTCERCVVDTMALALTYCHAKYIVVDSHTVSPLLNYYSNKYLGDVTVELTKACIKIKDNPRH